MLLQITTSKIFIDSVPFLYQILSFSSTIFLCWKFIFQRTHLQTRKKPYVFRSRNLITYTQEDIINEIDRSGTTFTATETFRPKKGRDPRTPVRDHTISLHFEKDQRFSEELRDMKFKRLGFQKLCVPYISVIKNGIIGKTDIFQPGDSVLIKGRFLKFDYYNSTQGLFFKNKETAQVFKATSFTRLTRLSVQALIPTELQAGIYSVYIATDGNKRSNSVEIEIST